MIVDLPYGKESVGVHFPDSAKLIYPPFSSAVEDERAEIRRALDNPIGSPTLRRFAKGKTDAAIVINDITRPAPNRLMLEEILTDLREVGIKEDLVTVIIATGNHRPSTQKEIEYMLGENLASRLRILNHDSQDKSNLFEAGITKSGLPVWVNSTYKNASLKIATGIITPHHGAGYSGGRKSIIPGIAGLETLYKHHSFPIRQYEPMIGKMKGNPFHEAAVEGARLAGVDFILNVVKNQVGKVVYAVAGDLENAHENGVMLCKKNWAVDIVTKYDVVVVTPGGFPRDIDLHQAQKAMSVAEMVLDKKGIMVLIAKCTDGIGKFAEWLKKASTPRQVIERFMQTGFTPDQSSKAFMCARGLDKHTVILSCGGICREDVENMFFKYASNPQTAVDMALESKGPNCSVLVLPFACDCIP